MTRVNLTHTTANNYQYVWLFPITLCFLLFAENAIAAQARCHAVKDSQKVGDCEVDPENWASWEDACTNWQSEMSYSTKTTETFTEARELCDNQYGGWCRDNSENNLDYGDATLFSGHGDRQGSTYSKYFVANLSTTDHNDSTGFWGDTCWADSREWMLGDNDAEFVTFMSCQSASLYYGIVPQHWNSHTKRLHQLHGWHCSSTSASVSDVDEFTNEAVDEELAWAWITEMVRWGDEHDLYYDRCPVALIWGSSASDVRIRRDNESYDNGQYTDPPSTGAVMFPLYWCGCDPVGPGGTPLTC